MNDLGKRAYAHVRKLSVEIGTRLIGTPSHHAAADYIADQLAQAGLAVERQPIPCPNWEEGPASVQVEGLILPAYANTFSPAATVTAPTLALGTLAELRAANRHGRLLIFYGALAQHELAAQGAIYVSPRDREILDLLAAQPPAGLITVNPSLHARWRLVEDFDLPLPSVTVQPREGLALVQHSGAVACLTVQAQRAAGHTDNLVARRPGPRPERLVVCAHYDTKADTPGAYDNAAGVGVLLAVAEALSKSSLSHTLECVSFTGEEAYGLGDMEYARRQAAGSGFGTITAALNLDGPGPYLAANTLAVFAANDDFKALAEAAAARYPGVAQVDPWPASDHYIFYSNGVPSLAIRSLGVKDQYHTPDDNLDWISPAKLDEAAHLALDLIAALDDKPLNWGRPQ